MRKANVAKMLADFADDQAERGSGVRFFKVPVGKTYVRLLPPRGSDDEDTSFIVRGGTHWLNEQSIACPLLIGAAKSCFLCNRVAELRASSDSADKREAADLAVRRRYYANIILPNDPEAGIQVWEFGPQVAEQIYQYIGDGEYGDISDPDEGYDLIVERTGEGKKSRYRIRCRKSPSALPQEIRDQIEDDPEALHDLRTLRPIFSNEEMEELYAGSRDEYGDEEPAPPKYRVAPSKPRWIHDEEELEDDEEDEERPPAR